MTGSDRLSPMTGLRGMARGPLVLLALLGALKALGLILIADAIAAGVVGLIRADSGWHSAVVLGVAGALLRSGVAWGTQVVAERAMIGEKQRIRAELARRLVDDRAVQTDGGTVGAMTALATRGLDELDKYYTVFLPALVSAATVPLLIGVRILAGDWLSAVVIVVTVPLIPVFMALIGMHTQERVAAASDAMARLSDHLVELARGLPVLVGLGRVEEQTEALRSISDAHRRTSVRTLRTAFLSSLALELVAMISVAVVAVLIGVRLVNGTMPLEVGLLALILAPECFAPFRDIGSAFHASRDGVEALRRVQTVTDAAAPASGLRTRRGSRVRADGLTVRYLRRSVPAVAQLSFDTQPRGITLLHGASGAGKSTVLAALAGVLPCDADVSGGIVVPDKTRIAYLPQHPHTVGATALDELRVYGAQTATQMLELHALDVLGDLGLRESAETDPALMSPGELRRLAFARVVMRVRGGAELVLLDEPTAHLDGHSAAIVRRAMAMLADSATIVVASHDPAVHAMADRWVLIGSAGTDMDTAADLSQPSALAAPASERTSHAATPQQTSQLRYGVRHPVRELAEFLRPVLPRLIGATLVGATAALFAIALTAVSGWLIVRASEHPPILYLLVAIVGVRFFGIGRGVLRWSERLLSHDAVFAAVTALRVRLWRGLAANGPANRALLTAGSTLDRLVSDADQVRDLVPRVVMPPLVGVVTTAAASVALFWIYPPAGTLMVALTAIGLIAGPLTAMRANRAAAAGASKARSASVRTFAALLGASAELAANGVDAVVRDRVAVLDTRLADADRRGAWSLGIGNALVVFACACTAVLMMPLASAAVSSGVVTPGLLAVMVLTPLGLIDPLLACVDAAQHWPTLLRVLGRVADVTSAAGIDHGQGDDQLDTVRRLEIEDLAYRYQHASAPAFSGASAAVERGEWLAVSGPSGSGKSTLLAVLLRYLAPTGGRYILNDTDAASASGAAVRARIAWCPQDGHLFDSSLRANLLIARGRDDAPSEREMHDALARVGLGDFLTSLPDGLDTGVGSAGGFLSGGQRQRVAVARTLLARSDVVMLDEPTAHLDESAAAALMDDLRTALADKIAVLVTHQPVGVAPDDVRLVLAQRMSTGESVERVRVVQSA